MLLEFAEKIKNARKICTEDKVNLLLMQKRRSAGPYQAHTQHFSCFIFKYSLLHLFFYMQPVYKQIVIRWQIAKQLLLINSKTWHVVGC